MDQRVKHADDRSSDGEEDFESADEGEGKAGKVDSETAAKTQNDDQVSFCESNVTDDGHMTNGKTTQKPEHVVNSSDLDKNRQTPDRPESKTLTGKLSAVSLEDSSDDTRENRDDVEKSEALSVPGGDTPDVITTEDKLDVKNDSAFLGSVSNASVPGGVTGGKWGSWGSWGAVFNQATASVTSGLSHVIETVETTLGIPEPGELDEVASKDEKQEVITTEPKSAEIQRRQEDEEKSDSVESDKTGSSESFLSSWGLSSISDAVTSKGLELVSEGIDALETIGKKTMNVISDGDPGLRAKRTMFQKTTLSQVLREAKEKSAKDAAERKKQEVLERANFNDEFDRYQGLAHLEALELLSRESEGKVESVLIDMFEDDLERAKTKLRAIENVFDKTNQNDEENEGREDVEFAEEIGKCAMALNLAFVPDKLNQTEESVSKWLKECVEDQEKEATSRSPDDIYSNVVTSLANLTSKSIEVFRKVAEMILLADEQERAVSAEDRAVHLCRLTKIVTDRISSLSANYAHCLNTAADENEDNDNITPVITEVYLECSNSSSHVQDAFKLLLPVLQVSALNDLKKLSK